MLNFISFLTGSAHPESREFPSPSGRGSFRMRAGKEKKLFPSSLFLFLWRVSYKKKIKRSKDYLCRKISN
jgi:hypothetical protein